MYVSNELPESIPEFCNVDALQRRVAELERRLEEAEEALRAIRTGDVDAIVVVANGRERLLTFETTDRSYRLMVEQMRQGAALLDPHGIVLYANASLATMIGRPLEALTATPIQNAVHSDSQDALRRHLLSGGSQVAHLELTLLRADGGLVPAYLSLSRSTDSDTLVAVITDLTEQRVRERLEIEIADRTRLARQLKQSEARLQLALSAANMGVWTHDIGADALTLDASAQKLFMVGPHPTRAEIVARIHPDDQDRITHEVAAACQASTAQGETFEYRLREPDGGVRWVRTFADILFENAAAAAAVGTVEDISDRKKWESTQKLLIDELNHRVKNTLATIQAIAFQTHRTKPDPTEFMAAFSGRLNALATAHSLLTQSRWEAADLADIVQGQLASEDPERIVYSGPRISFCSQTALSIALVLHELGTNARKYGALSTANGHIELIWSMQGDEDRTIQINWSEHGGPPFKPSARVGFGTRLIEQSIKALRGRVSIEFGPMGLVCRMCLPPDAPAKGICTPYLRV